MLPTAILRKISAALVGATFVKPASLALFEYPGDSRDANLHGRPSETSQGNSVLGVYDANERPGIRPIVQSN